MLAESLNQLGVFWVRAVVSEDNDVGVLSVDGLDDFVQSLDGSGESLGLLENDFDGGLNGVDLDFFDDFLDFLLNFFFVSMSGASSFPVFCSLFAAELFSSYGVLGTLRLGQQHPLGIWQWRRGCGTPLPHTRS